MAAVEWAAAMLEDGSVDEAGLAQVREILTEAISR